MPVGADAPGPEVTLDRLLMLVGRINYVWANTESLLIHLIAGLCKIDKDRAVVIFLTLNTARARLDLVERLSKLDDVAVEQRDAILAVTRRMTKVSALRNRLNHSIYAFDPESGQAKTILMRISDRKDSLKIGRNDLVDLGAIAEIEQDIALIGQINADIWHIIRKFGYPA
jgi:hypothetical protein